MRRHRPWLALLALLALCATAVLIWRHRGPPSSRNLDSIFVFRDAARCEPRQPLAGIIERMIVYDPVSHRGRAGPPTRIEGYSEPLRSRVKHRFGMARDAMGWGYEAEIELIGWWHGLKVLRLTSHSDGESDTGHFAIRFDESPDHVRAVLNRFGHRIPPLNESDMSGWYLRAEHGGTMLYCEGQGS